MRKIPFLIVGFMSLASDFSTDFTLGVSRQDLSGRMKRESSESILKATYPVVSIDGGVSYPIAPMWGTSVRVQYGGPSLDHAFDNMNLSQDYDVSARWLVTYGEGTYIQFGPIFQRSKVSFGWESWNDELYMDGYGLAFGVYHPLLEYFGLRVNFQHVINNAVKPCELDPSKEIGTYETGVSQLSIALSSDLAGLL